MRVSYSAINRARYPSSASILDSSSMRASSSDFSCRFSSSSSDCRLDSRARRTSSPTFSRVRLCSSYFSLLTQKFDPPLQPSDVPALMPHISASLAFIPKSSSSLLRLASRARSSTFIYECLCSFDSCLAYTIRCAYSSAFKRSCSSLSYFSLASSTRWAWSSDFSCKSSSSDFSLASSTRRSSSSAFSLQPCVLLLLILLRSPSRFKGEADPLPPPSAVRAHAPLLSALHPQQVKPPLQPSAINLPPLPQILDFPL